jgi:hypothetical protein
MCNTKRHSPFDYANGILSATYGLHLCGALRQRALPTVLIYAGAGEAHTALIIGFDDVRATNIRHINKGTREGI